MLSSSRCRGNCELFVLLFEDNCALSKIDSPSSYCLRTREAQLTKTSKEILEHKLRGKIRENHGAGKLLSH